VSPRLRGRREVRLRGSDLLELLTDPGVHWRGLAGTGVHMEIHLFSCCNESVVPTPVQGVEQMHSLVIDRQKPRQNIERLEQFRLGPMSDVRLNRI
jgi:hypothetical protein